MAKAYLKEILQLTIEKFKQNGTFDLDENKILEKEYQEVEQVLPSPGKINHKNAKNLVKTYLAQKVLQRGPVPGL